MTVSCILCCCLLAQADGGWELSGKTGGSEARLDAQRSEAFARDNPRRPRRPDADVAADSPADGGAQSQGNAQ